MRVSGLVSTSSSFGWRLAAYCDINVEYWLENPVVLIVCKVGVACLLGTNNACDAVYPRIKLILLFPLPSDNVQHDLQRTVDHS